jgi:AraC-like DNA-binding protein
MPHPKAFNRLYTFKEAIESFNFNIGAIFVLALLNVLYKIRLTSNGIESATNLWNPTWLLFGPFIYYAFLALHKKTKSIKRFVIHLLPFFIYLLFYSIDLLSVDLGHPWGNPLYVWYQNTFFIIPISLINYAIKVLMYRKSINALQIGGELLLIISGFYIIIGILSVLMYLCWGVLNIDMGIDYRIFTYAFLLIIEVFILRYTYTIKYFKENERPAADFDLSYANSSLLSEQTALYLDKMKQYFSEDKSFLNPDLSLEILSRDLDIPKYYFSHLFNVHFGKNFYNFIAEHRINYALRRLMEENGKMKIESLAYECGFNSKTSFNRYFKQRTGCTPLEYVNKNDLMENDIGIIRGAN